MKFILNNVFFVFLTALKTTIIYPATQKHIQKYSIEKLHLFQESPNCYASITLPYIEKESFSLEVKYNKQTNKKQNILSLLKMIAKNH